MWTTFEVSDTVTLPKSFYPAFAPLPIPIAEHLVLQVAQQERDMPPHELLLTVLERVEQARQDIYEYMHTFVLEDALKPRRGRGASFPDKKWLLDELRTHTPKKKRATEETLDDWQERGLLLREWARGPFDLDSVASLMIARIVEDQHIKGWLPSSLEEQEPRWWAYGKESPTSSVVSVPLPLPESLPSMLLWTPWTGAAWKPIWHVEGNIACRWVVASPTRDDLIAHGVHVDIRGK